ncbi:MAG: anhydro-N-acetylmuramic acid kinase [Methylophaga sp.]|nr:MAG: anhydro-N-acetylmuramic acid kinase [Methylophaga sp.]
MSYYIGVMSGTSLDGIDVALTTFDQSGTFQFVTAQTFPFPEQLLVKLQQLISTQQYDLQQLGEVNVALGQLIAQSVNQLLTTAQLTAKDIAAIGSHGQTLFHSPEGSYPFSLQIGDANTIAEHTGITTVADFRQRDIAAGGQGAPLVPAFHQALFNSATEDRVIVNIGGISNLTLLPSSTNNDSVIGFDTGPGNVLLDYWTQLQLKQPYDQAGKWAASGQCNKQLLTQLLNDPYFKQAAPKSTGRELFNQTWLETKLTSCQQDLSPADIQATLVELTAQTIADDIKIYPHSSSTVFICGGGAHNDYLLSRLQALLTDKKVTTTEEIGLHPDWVEACAFAWLAYRTLNKQSGNLPAVTGAKHPVVLGAIYPS